MKPHQCLQKPNMEIEETEISTYNSDSGDMHRIEVYSMFPEVRGGNDGLLRGRAVGQYHIKRDVGTRT